MANEADKHNIISSGNPETQEKRAVAGNITDALADTALPRDLDPVQADEFDDTQKALSRLGDLYPALLDHVEHLRSIAHAHLQLHPEMKARDESIEAIKKFVAAIDTALDDEYLDRSRIDRLSELLGKVGDGRRDVNGAKQSMYDEEALQRVDSNTQSSRTELIHSAEAVGRDDMLPDWVVPSDKFLREASYSLDELAEFVKRLDKEDDQAQDDYRALVTSFSDITLTLDKPHLTSLRRRANDLLATFEYANGKRDKVHEAARGLRELCDKTLNILPEKE
ncbi:MAG TPA: hypothetical protein VGE34_00465 [Candidatus Saccharimonadales bacterium]